MEIEGIADLPLHTGHVPPWLVPIMKRLAKGIVDIMSLEWGTDKVVERLSNPLWFQSFNNAIGMDWDSSGSTTVTLGILKDVLSPSDGLVVIGGKGKNARKVPEELRQISKYIDVDVESAERSSRLAAKVDTTLVQDGHQLYHHSMIISESGKWGIIQQGMNPETKFARRYHWKNTQQFIVEPHEAIAGVKGVAVNVIEKDKEETRKTILDLLRENPRKIVERISIAKSALRHESLDFWLTNASVVGISKEARIVYMKPIDESKLLKVLNGIYETNPSTLEEALLSGMGPSTARALFLISDLIYSEPPSFKDPVNYPPDPFKYAYAIGGKDGIPYPVNRRVALEVIHTIEEIVEKAKIDRKEKDFALKKLRDKRHRTKKGT
ncbi:DUF763 domain-containing protein [Acidianus sp. RZ1]|uniref:DUF763 domain-containing protein n=1 Tax=Acidianus sp. RZ1 TaxID=1540082 RepID=UPI0014931377|nr:DUF763 domain-containing protein [Acidianus sp. RZ1]NON62658.1 DUF763 domain-containing protein [Acidianus sp. RZ1]